MNPSKKLTPQDGQKANIVVALNPIAARVRVEIDEFLGDTAMTNVFLIALYEMQNSPLETKEKEDWWTFYNLSSIHGQPDEKWNDVPGRNGEKAGGYCTHGLTTFPPWHRIYVLMFEQAVSNKIHEIADRYTSLSEKKRYKDAALRFRLPFWDPFMPRNRVQKTIGTVVDKAMWGLPKILEAKNVYVKFPNHSKLTTIRNPLYDYTFPSEESVKEKARKPIDWSLESLKKVSTVHTVRTPDEHGNTNIENLNSKIREQAQTMTTKCWQLLHPDHKSESPRTWETFANHWKNKAKRITWDANVSLESWHDVIHGTVGTGSASEGHMGHVPVAAFDPIFWLHHCNIDRLFAIYQSLYPEKYVKEADDKDGLNIKSSLYPFRRSQETYHTSLDAHDWKGLGFAIPGHTDLDEDGREIVKQYLNDNYYWITEGSYPPESLHYPRDLSKVVALYGDKAGIEANPSVKFEAIKRTESESFTRVMQAIPLTEASDVTEIEIANAIRDATDDVVLYPPVVFEGAERAKMRTYNAHLHVRKFAFDGSFNIHIFISHDVEAIQPENYFTDESEVGVTTVFASGPQAVCVNCDAQRAGDMIYEDAIPLTSALMKYLPPNNESGAGVSSGSPLTLDNLEPENVVPFLTKHLHWRITDMASNRIDDEAALRRSLLQIAVSDRLYDLPTDANKLGTYHEAAVHIEATSNKLGGYGYAGN